MKLIGFKEEDIKNFINMKQLEKNEKSNLDFNENDIVKVSSELVQEKDEVFIKNDNRNLVARKEFINYSIEEQEKYLFVKKIICNCCKKEIYTNLLRKSRLKIIDKDTDLFTYYEGIYPIMYEAIICTNCGYADLENRFNKLTKSEYENLNNDYSKSFKKREFNLIRSLDETIEIYKIIFINYLINKPKSYDEAKLLHKLAILYRLKNDRENEIKFLKLSVKSYEESYLKGENFDNFKIELQTIYLIAELSRIIGDYVKSSNYFQKIMLNKNLKNMTILKKLVEDQYELLRIEYGIVNSN